MDRNPVGWFEIYVDDIDRAKRFYESMLGARLDRLESPGGSELEMWSFPMRQDAPGAAGALVRMDGYAPGGGGTLIYFSCADCAVEAGRAREHGGTVVQDKMAIGQYGHIALVKDTEGNVVGLHSMA